MALKEKTNLQSSRQARDWVQMSPLGVNFHMSTSLLDLIHKELMPI